MVVLPCIGLMVAAPPLAAAATVFFAPITREATIESCTFSRKSVQVGYSYSVSGRRYRSSESLPAERPCRVGDRISATTSELVPSVAELQPGQISLRAMSALLVLTILFVVALFIRHDLKRSLEVQ